MAVYFAPQPRDPDAELKQYMLMMAQLLGKKRQETKEQGQMTALAESLVPQPTSTINNQQLFSDQGFDALRGNVLEGTPAAFGQAPGQPLNQMQILQKALSSGLPIQDAMSVVRGIRPQASPTQQIAQKRLDRIDVLEAKVQAGTATEAEKKELKRKIGPAPLVEFSGLDKLLSPEQRVAKATQPLKKPLTSTEIKGVGTIIDTTIGFDPSKAHPGRAIPFGIKPGPAKTQADVEQMWEQVVEETGYHGRSKVAQKQIASRFDRKIATLNKGKGVTILAKQYEWDRKKWEVKQGTKRRPGESIDEFIERTGL